MIYEEKEEREEEVNEIEQWSVPAASVTIRSRK